MYKILSLSSQINAMEPQLMVQILNFLSTESLIDQSNKSEFQDIRAMSAYLIASRTNTNLAIHWLSTCSREMESFVRKELVNIPSSNPLLYTARLLNDANCFQSILDGHSDLIKKLDIDTTLNFMHKKSKALNDTSILEQGFRAIITHTN